MKLNWEHWLYGLVAAFIGGSVPYNSAKLGPLPYKCTNHTLLNNDIGVNLPPW